MRTASDESTKVLVSCERYTELLNEELRSHSEYPAGLGFIHQESGFVLFDSAGALHVTQVMAISAEVDHIVSLQYTIARDLT
jgi:hypothetical protein